MSRDKPNLLGSVLATGGRRSRHGASRADQIVEHNGGAALDVARENLSRDLSHAPVLVHEAFGDRSFEQLFHSVAEQFRALFAAEIGRDDGERLLADFRRDITREDRLRVERRGAATKGVLKRREIVNVDYNDSIGSDRFEHLRDITRRHRITRLCLTVLARVAKIGNHRRNTSGAGILERSDKEQQATELVRARPALLAMQRINDVDVAIANIDQWTGLVFAVLELALLMGTEFRMEMASDLLAQGTAGP